MPRAPLASNPTKKPAPRRQRPISSDDVKIEQFAPIIDHKAHTGDFVRVDQDVLADKDYMDKLAFNEEPVVIEIAKNREKNAATVVYCAVNGKGAEILMNGKWHSIGHLPTGQAITTKRKYVEVLLRALHMQVETNVIEQPGQDPVNEINRNVTRANAIQIIADENPKGRAWLSEMLRRAA